MNDSLSNDAVDVPSAKVGPLAERPHLFGLFPEEVDALLSEHGVSPRDGDARRVMAHVVGNARDDLGLARPPAKAVSRAVEACFERAPLELVDRAEDPSDGFVKYLFRSPDGALSEAVRIPLHAKGRYSVCLSSQVGCAMKCDFCATGRLGLGRHLAAWEMIAAWRAVRADLEEGRVSGAVFMGQGEPLHNYDEVIRAASILSHPCGGRIGAEAISISTVGLVPQIRRYTREGHRFRLIVSLTSALPDRRRSLLPVAGRVPFDRLIEAIREHALSRKGLMTVAWVLLGGVNHDQAEVDALKDAFGDIPLRLNLIDVNDAREDGYRRATDVERKRFIDAAQVLGAPIVRRYSGGRERHAACGMLAAAHGPELG